MNGPPRQKSNVFKLPLTFVMLQKESAVVCLVVNPRSNRIVLQWSQFDNGDALFKYKDFHAVISNLLGQGWREIERGDYE